MILTWLVAPILDMLNGLFSALPTVDLSWLTGFTSYEGVIIEWTNQANFFAPMQTIVFCVLFVVFVFLPAIFIYQLAQWGYRELPTIFGFGPSS